MFYSGKQIEELCSQQRCSIASLALEQECADMGAAREDVLQRLRDICAIMETSSHNALYVPIPTQGGMITGNARKMEAYAQSGAPLCGPVLAHAMALAFSGSETNASMGKICAAPTAGACGILPAALLTAVRQMGLVSCGEEMIRGLLTAGAVGQVIARNATLSGAEGGCQAECGAAASMAAAAAAEMKGGTPEQALKAAGIALMNILGLVCDPIAGLVEMPCALRNGSGVLNALLSADMALAGIDPIVPFDEVVDAMYKIGRMLPSTLRETALGGIAATAAARAIESRQGQ